QGSCPRVGVEAVPGQVRASGLLVPARGDLRRQQGEQVRLPGLAGRASDGTTLAVGVVLCPGHAAGRLRSSSEVTDAMWSPLIASMDTGAWTSSCRAGGNGIGRPWRV